jgi:hypothetical protein
MRQMLEVEIKNHTFLLLSIIQIQRLRIRKNPGCNRFARLSFDMRESTLSTDEILGSPSVGALLDELGYIHDISLSDPL